MSTRRNNLGRAAIAQFLVNTSTDAIAVTRAYRIADAVLTALGPEDATRDAMAAAACMALASIKLNGALSDAVIVARTVDLANLLIAGSDGPDGGGSGGEELFWAPGQAGALQTWAEVMGAVANTSGLLEFVFDPADGACVIPAGTYDTQGRLSLNPLRVVDDPSIFTITIEDGAHVKNLRGMSGAMSLQSLSSSPCLSWDPYLGATSQFATTLQALLIANGSSPMIDLSGAKTLIMLQEQGGGFGGGSEAVVALGNSGQLTINVLDRGSILSTSITGTAGSGLTLNTDASLVLPDLSGSFTGTLFGNLFDVAKFTKYDATTPGNWSPTPTDVNGALDQLAARSTTPPFILGVTSNVGGAYSNATGAFTTVVNESITTVNGHLYVTANFVASQDVPGQISLQLEDLTNSNTILGVNVDAAVTKLGWTISALYNGPPSSTRNIALRATNTAGHTLTGVYSSIKIEDGVSSFG